MTNTGGCRRRIERMIPPEFTQLASVWHDGQDSLLYAVASTGDLTRGDEDFRPWDDDENRPMTDNEWQAHLWFMLFCELANVCRMNPKHPDHGLLVEFRDFAMGQYVHCELRNAPTPRPEPELRTVLFKSSNRRLQ
jgi:hypothetical protein